MPSSAYILGSPDPFILKGSGGGVDREERGGVGIWEEEKQKKLWSGYSVCKQK